MKIIFGTLIVIVAGCASGSVGDLPYELRQREKCAREGGLIVERRSGSRIKGKKPWFVQCVQ